MKKKLNIQQLKVTSFVTTVDENAVKGGDSLVCNTQASCLDYISCWPTQCILRTNDDACLTKLIG